MKTKALRGRFYLLTILFGLSLLVSCNGGNRGQEQGTDAGNEANGYIDGSERPGGNEDSGQTPTSDTGAANDTTTTTNNGNSSSHGTSPNNESRYGRTD